MSTRIYACSTSSWSQIQFFWNYLIKYRNDFISLGMILQYQSYALFPGIEYANIFINISSWTMLFLTTLFIKDTRHLEANQGFPSNFGIWVVHVSKWNIYVYPKTHEEYKGANKSSQNFLLVGAILFSSNLETY